MTQLPKIGDTIRLITLAPDNDGVPDPSWNKWRHKGDLGTVTSIDIHDPPLSTQIWVTFEDGGHLALLYGIDTYEILK